MGRSRSRGADKPLETRTLAITEGLVQTRLWLKKEMERFGRVEVCHTGNRMNPVAEPPWVRFATTTAAEVALKCISEGQVLVDGVPVTAVMKPAGGGGNRLGGHIRETGFKNEPAYPKTRDVEITSRELALEARRAAVKRRDRKSSS